jgi:squalene-hopene/tetraprenyl-beta-curcumene cyclase
LWAKARRTLDNARQRLLAERTPSGVWHGELSPSALSTAVAVFALDRVNRNALAPLIRNGLDWIVRHANTDGGWGDTPASPSNLSTTLLVWSALSLDDGSRAGVVKRAEEYIACAAGSLDPDGIARAVLAAYGNDRTFSVPILTLCALAGRLGPEPQVWRRIPQLPFELAALPHQTFKWLQLPVVSYAIPALIAIGLVRHRRAEQKKNLWSGVRERFIPRVLDVLIRIQPVNGGFLEAAPLTAFVSMSLASSGLADHVVTQRCAEFLRANVRPDGSWPIDTNLATWVTTLSVNALSSGPDAAPLLTDSDRAAIRAWLLGQQWRTEHPFTHAAPGGWAWTDLKGGVPDADDTSGALVALRRLGPLDNATREAAQAGLRWLLDLQNRDGGIPTFCHGWGKLPFDRSCPDITAHALLAFQQWRDAVPDALRLELERASLRGLDYLTRVQQPDGSWLPLWFGNQSAPGKINPTYGTAQVLHALRAFNPNTQAAPTIEYLVERGTTWLLHAQNADGGGAVFPARPRPSRDRPGPARRCRPRADRDDSSRPRLADRSHRPRPDLPAAPIGLYFSQLWYHERLYPLVFTVAALERVQGARNNRIDEGSSA